MARSHRYRQPGGVAKAASTIQAAWRASRGARLARFQPLVRTTRVGRQALVNLATGVAGAIAGRRLTSHSTKMKTGRIMNEGTGGQFSSFSVKNGNYLEPGVHSTLKFSKSIINGAGQLKSAVGLQNVAVGLVLYDQSDISTISSDINGGANKRNALWLDKVSASLILSNIYLANCTVDIYDIVARKDNGTVAIGGPQNAWSQGNSDETAASEYLKLGNTPFSSDVFNQYYKVLQTTRVVLGGGQMHKHRVNLDVFKKMSASYLTYAGYQLRDLTYSCMIVVHGAPANDTTTQTQVSLGAGGVNYIFEKEYHTSFLQDFTSITYDHSNLLNAFTVAEQVVDVGGTIVTPNVEG